jgi:hypothetical protein
MTNVLTHFAEETNLQTLNSTLVKQHVCKHFTGQTTHL